MTRPIIYDPNDDVNAGNWTSFVWQPQYIAYITDGEDVTAGVTNRSFVESLYGLTDHVQYLWFDVQDAQARIVALYTKLGVPFTNAIECFSGTYINGCKTFLQAFNILDAAIANVSTQNAGDSSKLANLITRMSPVGGPLYGSDPNLPLFSGDGVTGGLITSGDRVHTAINKIAAQTTTDRDNLVAQTNRINNLVSNVGPLSDTPQSITNPGYNLAAGVTIISSGDTLITALKKISDYIIGPAGTVIPVLANYPILTRVREVVGKNYALDAATTVYQDGSKVANLITNVNLGVTPETGGQSPAHHQALVLYDNLLEASLRQEEAANSANNQIQSLVIDAGPVVGYFETVNPLFWKHQAGLLPAANIVWRDRKIIPSTNPCRHVSVTIPLTALGGNATQVLLVPAVDNLANVDLDFEFWVNASDNTTEIPSSPPNVKINASGPNTFGTWVSLPTPASAGGRVICRFISLNGVLRGWRVFFAT